MILIVPFKGKYGLERVTKCCFVARAIEIAVEHDEIEVVAERHDRRGGIGELERQLLCRRLRRPDKHWKFNPGDLKERARWDSYMEAYEMALSRCSTEYAPWYVIPAENRWFRDLVISQLLVDTLSSMDPRFPEPDFDPTDYPPESLT